MVGIVALWMLLPLSATMVGGWAATRRSPGPRLTSGLQHFAAGIVIAAVCTEVVPEAMATRDLLAVVIGFSIGVILVMTVREWSGEGARRSGRDEKGDDDERVSLGMLITTGIDLLVDGLLIGLGFVLSSASGQLLVIAVTFEVLFIGMSLSATMSRSNVPVARIMCILLGLGGLILLGGTLGAWLLVGASTFFLSAMAAFATAALLYLVVEELLVEAHEQGETTIGSLLFFIGFGISLVLSMLLG